MKSKKLLDTFPQRLKELRTTAELTQGQLAEKLGVSRGSISFYENGDRIPDIEFLDSVSSFFGVSINYMLGHANHQKEDNENIGSRLNISDKAIFLFEKFKHSGEAFSAAIEVLDPGHVFACIFDEVNRQLETIETLDKKAPVVMPSWWSEDIDKLKNARDLLEQACQELENWD